MYTVYTAYIVYTRCILFFMVRLTLKGEYYIVDKEDARIVRDAMGQKGEGAMRIPTEQINEVVCMLVKTKGYAVQEYTEINGKEVKMREASPGNWTDFAECLVDDTEPGKIAGIVLDKCKENRTYRVHIAVFCTLN